MTLVWFALLVGLLITVHELGHYGMARLFGVRVIRLAVGFGWPLLRLRHRQTEYVLGIVPLGGYVRLAGEEPTTPSTEPDSLRARPLWQRLCIIFAGPLANGGFAALIFMSLAWTHPGAPTATLGTLFAGQPAADAELHAGDRVVAVEGQSVRAWGELNRRVLSSPGRPLRITVEREGARGEPARRLTKYVTPRAHLQTDPFGARHRVGLIGVAPYYTLPQIGLAGADSPAYKAGLRTFDVVTAIHGRPVVQPSDLEPLLRPQGGGMLLVTFLRPEAPPLDFLALSLLTPRTAQVVPVNVGAPGSRPVYDAGVRPAATFVRTVEPKTPAFALGLAAGDEIVTLDGQPVTAWEMLTQRLDEHPREAHTLGWRSADGQLHAERLRLEPRQRFDEYKNQSTYWVFGAEGARAVVPVPTLPPERNPLVLAGRGIARAWAVTGTLVRAFALTLVGKLPASSIGGPLLVYEAAGVAARRGFDHLLTVAAVISLDLGLLNLLPVPLLDGGQALLLLLESARQRPLSTRTRERLTLLGLLLLLAIMLLALRNDLARYLSTWMPWS